MRLFDDIERDDVGYKSHSEPLFCYHNRSARPEVARIRALLEQWFSHSPAEMSADVRGRFRDDDDFQHGGALFEIYCNAFLECHGLRTAIHQIADESKTTTPDFLASRNANPVLYLESTTAVYSRKERASGAILKNLRDCLNRLESPSFFVGMEVLREPTGTPSASRIRLFLKEKLRALDPDQVATDYAAGGLENLPRWICEDAEGKFAFFPIPKSPDAREKPGLRPVGVLTTGLRYVDGRGPLLHALEDKAGRYGEPDLPYIVAVNILSDDSDGIGVSEALFGTEQFRVDWETHQTRADRARDGLWMGPNGPRYTRVSAALIVDHLDEWHLAQQSPILWHNPWAKKPVDIGLFDCDQMIVDIDSDSLRCIQGREAWEILSLPPHWPFDEA